MVDNLQKPSAPRSHGARLLAAHKDKGAGGRTAGAKPGSAAYRSNGVPPLPFPVLVPPSPAVQSMPSRRENLLAGRDNPASGSGGARDAYSPGDDDDDDVGAPRRDRPATTSGRLHGLTLGKRTGGPVLGGSEPKKQAHLQSLFAQAHRRQQAARLVPAGMVNLGNTCYLNSVVQVVLGMPSFARDLQHPALESLREYMPVGAVWSALRTTAAKLRTAAGTRPSSDGFKPAVEPCELRAAMGRRSARWRTCTQQDAHEFFVELLEALQSEVLAAEGAASGARKVRLSATRDPAARNLSGCLVHTWTCSGCGRCTRVKELFSCLSLQLPPQGCVKLEDLLADYLKDETIDKNCDGCSPNTPIAHTAQHHFWRLPRVLAVHIKRFMPLPQQPEPQQQQQQPQRQEPQAAARPPTENGGRADAGSAAAAAVLAADESAHTEQASGTAPCDAPSSHPDQAAAGARAASGTATGGTAGPSAPASRDTSPPAPYLYAKVHTAVEVRQCVDLARHCDAAATAHRHLLEGVPPAVLSRKDALDAANGAAAGDASAAKAAAAAPAGATAGGVCAGAGLGGGGLFARTPGAACTTLDTIGGGSTCPSPSLPPNASDLQEVTVQQQGQHTALKPSRQHRLSNLGAAKTPDWKGPQGHTAAAESELTTGAQAGAGGDGAPTPHGGVAPASLGKAYSQGQEEEREQDALGNMGRGSGSAGKDGVHGSIGGVRRIVPVDGGAATSTPQLQVRLAGILGGSCGGSRLQGGHQTSGGRRQGLQPRNDSQEAADDDLLSPPRSSGRADVAEAARSGGGDGRACSDRKGPKALGTGKFFGPPGTGLEDLHRGHDGTHGDLAAALDEQGAGRPAKRAKGTLGDSWDSAMGNSLHKTARRVPPARPSHAAATPASGKRLEDMTEEEQMQLAMQMSIAETQAFGSCGDAYAFGSCGDGEGDGGASGSGSGQRNPAATAPGAAGSDRPRGNTPAVDISVPTAAGRYDSGPDGAAVAATMDGTGGGKVRQPPSGEVEEVEGSGAQALDGGMVIELQDESPGGVGVVRGEQRGGKAGSACTRPAGSDPAQSGASGSRGENDGGDGGDENDCSTEAAPAGERRNRRRRGFSRRDVARIGRRRLGELQDDLIPDYAESPAVRPSRQQQPQRRRRQGSGSSGGGDADRSNDAEDGDTTVVCRADDDDDGTTALSPVSAAAAAAERRTNGRVPRDYPLGVPPPGHTAQADPYELPADDAEAANDADAADGVEDPEMAEVLRLSMHTFEAEEQERKLRASFGTGAGSDCEDERDLNTRLGGKGPFAAAAVTGAEAGSLGPAVYGTSKSREAETWQRVLELPEVDGYQGVSNTGVGSTAAACTGTGCRTPGLGSAPDLACTSGGDEDSYIRAPHTAGGAARSGGDGVRGPGRMEALVAAVGLGSSGVNDLTLSAAGPSAPAKGSGQRVGDSSCPRTLTNPWKSGGNGAGAGSDGGHFKFGFQTPAAAGGTGARRDNVVDLTGDGADDEDAELNKAIMLSLQESRPAADDDVTGAVCTYLVGADGADGSGGDNEAAATAPKLPRVVLQADSDVEDDGDKEEHDKSGGEDAAAAAAPAAVGSEPQPAQQQPPATALEAAVAAPPPASAPAAAGTSGGRTAGGGGSGSASGPQQPGVPLSQVARYRLQGVVRHKGYTPFSGHYVADVLVSTPNGQMWFEHNDSVVSHVDFARVREDGQKQGYMFFFVNDVTRAASTAALVAAAAATPLPEDDGTAVTARP